MHIRIKEFYENANILVTGGTGFIGKVLIEKLLRSQDNINKIYILIRGKKGKSGSERVKEDIFDQPIFDYLKEHNPSFMDKVAVFEGDITQPRLGLKQSDIDIILNEINIVFQVAASINMGATLKYNIKSNLYSVLELLKLCRKMTNLKSLVIVSTAYSNCNNKVIEEKIYKAPITAELVLKMCDELDDSMLKGLTEPLLNGLPNTYTLSKCVMENALLDYGDLPIVLLRPGVVVPALKEPLPGWVESSNGPTTIYYLGALGIFRMVDHDLENKTSWVPVDFCANALLCSAWHGTQERSRGSNELMIYNLTFNDYQIRYPDFTLAIYRTKVHVRKAIWKTISTYSNIKFLRPILFFLYNIVPALIIDGVLVLSGNKFRLMRLYKEKIIPELKVFAYFCNHEWIFKEDNVRNMLNSLDENERAIYAFDMSKVKYEDLAYTLVTGVKVYMAKEKMEDNHKAQKWHRILEVIHYAFLGIFWSFVIWLLFKFINLVNFWM